MPWDAKTYRARHNKKLTDTQAKKASSIANALLGEGKDDATAIRIANAAVKRKKIDKRYGKSKS